MPARSRPLIRDFEEPITNSIFLDVAVTIDSEAATDTMDGTISAFPTSWYSSMTHAAVRVRHPNVHARLTSRAFGPGRSESSKHNASTGNLTGYPRPWISNTVT